MISTHGTWNKVKVEVDKIHDLTQFYKRACQRVRDILKEKKDNIELYLGYDGDGTGGFPPPTLLLCMLSAYLMDYEPKLIQCQNAGYTQSFTEIHEFLEKIKDKNFILLDTFIKPLIDSNIFSNKANHSYFHYIQKTQ